MRILPGSCSRYSSYRKLAIPEEQKSTNASFKGWKGAGIGSLAGLAYVGAMSVVAAPFLPLSAGLIALGMGSGAIAGHDIENDFKK